MPIDRRQAIATLSLAAVAACLPGKVDAAASPCSLNAGCLLEGNADALRTRIELIDAAVQQLDVAYYAIDTGVVSLGLLEMLCEAAQRGVKVRLLVDPLPSEMPPALLRLLCSRGVAIRFYNPVRIVRPLEINLRMHVKLLAVDRAAMIIGSRNLQDSHFGLEEVNFADTDALIGGPICEEAAAFFDRLWVAEYVEPPELNDDPKLIGGLQSSPEEQVTTSQWRCRLAAARGNLHAVLQRCAEPEGRDCLEQVPMRLVGDLTADKQTSTLQEQVVAMIDSARRCVVIETPYPVFAHATIAAMRRARQRGVDVMLLTNSLRSTDRVATYAAYHNDKRRLLRMGVRIYEFDSRNHLHAKTLIIDDRLAMVGSHNFDSRSDFFNLELGVAFEDPRAVAMVRERFQRRLARGVRIDSPLEVVDAPGDDSRRLQLSIRRWTVNFYRGFL